MIEPGTPIAVVAPCGAYNVGRFEKGLAILRERGLDLRPLPGNLEPDRYFAAPDEVRLEQLVEACKAGRLEEATGLLDRGANVDHANGNGYTGLIYACIGGRDEVVKLLLQHGAEVNALTVCECPSSSY